LQKNHLDIEAIEINNAVPGLGVIKRFNQPKNQSEVCLLLPNQLLARDPGLNFEGSARFTIDRTDDAAALSLNKIMALFSVMPEKRAKALAWRFGFTPSGAIMSYSNIGQRLGLSPQAAFSQVQYGLQDLGRTGQQMKFMAARRAISCLISWSLQGNTALSLGELSQNLQSLHLLEKKPKGIYFPF